VETAGTRTRVVRHALAAARAHQRKETSIAFGQDNSRQVFDLTRGGMCARFVRQVYETALGLAPFTWQFAAPCARDMATMMRHAGVLIQTGDREPGDVVQIGTGYPGHIAVYVGEVDGVECIAENTSDATRGNPRDGGTKLTPWSAVASRVTGVFRICAVADEEPEGIKLILQQGDKATLLTAGGVLVGDTLMVPAREVGEALGYTVTDHVRDQRKAYLT
jgi:hypothetical protein